MKKVNKLCCGGKWFGILTCGIDQVKKWKNGFGYWSRSGKINTRLSTGFT